ALTVITGQDYGDSVSNWEGWWAANKDTWKPTKWKGQGRSSGTGTVTDNLDRSRLSEWENLKKQAKILVIGAGPGYCCPHSHDLDQIDKMADKLGLKVDRIDKWDLEKNEHTPLEEYTAVLCNCTHIREHCSLIKCPDCTPGEYTKDRLHVCNCPKQRHFPGRCLMGPKGKQKIKRYVAKGGYLFAEDWCMEDFLAQIFPQYVSHGPIRPEDEKVKVLPCPGMATHPYLRKIFFKPPKEAPRSTKTEDELDKIAHTWKIDKETRCIKIVDPKRVVTLLMSPDLEKYAEGHDAVAITFMVGGKDGKRPGVATGGAIKQDRGQMSGGRVLYVLSHFGKQDSQEDEYTLQNLMLNFLIEANERNQRYEKKDKKKKKK
ncbi:MAG: hypothetical protein ACYTAF_05715, partial [Planctomycetota bacterium]